MVKEVITGSPNVTYVWLDAFWNEQEARIVLRAIESLKKLEQVTFGNKGSRKWRKEEIEDFTWRTSGRLRRLTAYEVEELSSSSSARSVSNGLHLPLGFTSVTLENYPPPPILSLPRTLLRLKLSNLCPLPPSLSAFPLPPLLEYLHIELAPFSTDGITSILPTPFDLSHLQHLTVLILDGGKDTSNLVSREFFSTLKNAKSIELIEISYCFVSSFDFPDFIHWFFGDRRAEKPKKNDADMEDGSRSEGGKVRSRSILRVLLFFGEWAEEEIWIARRTMMACSSSAKGAGICWGQCRDDPEE
ncbi:hypothetical protein BT69DRAFT_114991 [Atractiella rhizophila]|nr:hypothetical protein BT69DRAFT_114991 [Atractiella rhizophila]